MILIMFGVSVFVHVSVCLCVCICVYFSRHANVDACTYMHRYFMAWLRLVGSLNLQVSFAKEPYKRDDILQKRPVIFRSLLIVATPQYMYIIIFSCTVMCTGWRRPIGYLKLQVIFCKRATNCRALLRKMTYEDKVSFFLRHPVL